MSSVTNLKYYKEKQLVPCFAGVHLHANVILNRLVSLRKPVDQLQIKLRVKYYFSYDSS